MAWTRFQFGLIRYQSQASLLTDVVPVYQVPLSRGQHHICPKSCL